MKKIFNLFVLMAMLAMVLTACAPTEVDDLFDDTAANRLDKAMNDYKDYLVAEGGKWEMLYFANEEEMGFYFVVTFKADGSVTISGDNKFITGGEDADGQKDYDVSLGYISKTSLWTITGDDGPSLSFSSLNEAFHFYCDPGVIPPGSTRHNGAGHEGDFEFNIISKTDNSCLMRGKKHGMPIVLNRLPADTDDEAYVAQRTAMQTKHFSNYIRTLYLTTSTGERFRLSDYDSSLPGSSTKPYLSNFYWLFVPVNGDPVSDRERMPLVVTATGVHFLNPLEFLAEYAVGANVVQDFTFQEDGSLLGDDGVTTIKADAPSDVFLVQSYKYTIDKKTELGGGFSEAYDQVVSDLKKAYKSTFNNIRIAYDSNRGGYYLTLSASKLSGACAYLLNIERVNDNTVRFSFNPDDDNAYLGDNAKAVYNDIAGLRAFMSLLTTGDFVLEVPSVLNPSVFTMRSTTDSGLYMVLPIS